MLLCLTKSWNCKNRYGSGKVIALLGNHEELVCEGMASVDACGTGSGDDDRYVSWLRGLPRYHAAGKTIFVHAGIDEEAEDLWKYGTMDHIFTEKYPAQDRTLFRGLQNRCRTYQHFCDRWRSALSRDLF